MFQPLWLLDGDVASEPPVVDDPAFFPYNVYDYLDFGEDDDEPTSHAGEYNVATPRVLTLNSTYRFKLAARKDNAVWDLTGASVYLLMQLPDGTSISRVGTILVAADGTAKYDSLTTGDLTIEGRYLRSWRVVQGGVDIASTPTPFWVLARP